MYNVLRCISAFGVATLTAACGAGDVAVDARWAGTRDTVSGVEVVRNPATPLLAAGDVAVSTLWTAPDPSAAPTADRPLWEAPAVVEAGRGTVYVLDRMARRVYALRAADGRWQATIGRPGGGPGEFERPQDLAVLGDTLVVLDGGKASVDFFGPDGRYRRSVHLNGVGFGILALAPDRLLVNMLQGSSGGWWIFDREGGRAQASFPAPVARHPEDPPDCGRTTTAGPHILRTSCTTLHFQRLDGGGAPVREVAVDRPPVRPSEAAIEAAIGRMRSVMERDGVPRAVADRVLDRQRERLRHSPRTRAVRQDPDTHRYALWEQTAEELGGGNAKLHLFSGDGIYLAELRFDREWVDFDVAGGTVFALVRDPETDLVRLVAYRIALSGIDATPGGH